MFTLHTQVAGAGFPILCLHGHPGSSASLSVFTEHLSQRFQTLTPDLRGYGKSRTQTPFAMTTHLEDLEALLDHHQVSRCLILGWSLGGILALELALRLPDRVSGLILVATAARPHSDHPPISWQDNLYTGVASILNRLRPGLPWVIETLGQRSLYRYLIQQHTPQAYHYLAAEGFPAYLQTSRVAQQALSVALRAGYNRLEAIAAIDCPALVMAAAGDRHIIPEASLETANYLKNSTWICYPNTAHLFPWEIPQQVRQDIDQWLTQNPAVITATAAS